MNTYPYPHLTYWEQQVRAGQNRYQHILQAEAEYQQQQQLQRQYEIQQQQYDEALRQRTAQYRLQSQSYQQAYPSWFGYGLGTGQAAQAQTQNYGYYDQPPVYGQGYGYGNYGQDSVYGQEPAQAQAAAQAGPTPLAQAQNPPQSPAKPEAAPTPGIPCPPPVDPAEATRLAREAGHTQLVEGVDASGKPYLYLPERPKGLVHTIKSWRWDY